MAENKDNVWPLPKFRFTVDFGIGAPVPFQEATGLNTEEQIVEYRAGNSAVFGTVKMPGLAKAHNVTLRKGIFPTADFWPWYDAALKNTATPRTVIIRLLDQDDQTKMTWTLTNARVVKVTSTDLKSDAHEAAVETIELICETLTFG